MAACKHGKHLSGVGLSHTAVMRTRAQKSSHFESSWRCSVIFQVKAKENANNAKNANKRDAAGMCRSVPKQGSEEYGVYPRCSRAFAFSFQCSPTKYINCGLSECEHAACLFLFRHAFAH